MKTLIRLAAVTFASAALFSGALDAQVKKPQSKAKSSNSRSVQEKKAQKKPVAVDINKASVASLQASLKGIGPIKAKAIVDYRKKNGSFKSTDDLLKVPGIGVATVAMNLASLKLPRGKVDLKAAAKSVNASSKKKGKSVPAGARKGSKAGSKAGAKAGVKAAKGKAKQKTEKAAKKAKKAAVKKGKGGQQ